MNYLHDSNSAYGDAAAHILDRVSSKTVYDPLGNIVAQTTTGYDSPAPASTASVVRHDYTGFSSANAIQK
jgi:hypothetical protein